ncbi:extracellular solute-binding protein [Microbacterium yannicii]|uniref:ABC transporter substrate-binding protein n=1 Tax=Microbacterium yannicii TaxID=671622 RepID=UPI00030AC1AA|nr:extracellular solute-binding protein [Microbacterium yannicii]
MRNTKTWAVGVTMVGALALGGCAGGQGQAAPEPTADLGAVEGEIQYAWWGGTGRNEKTQAVIDLYTAANPEVTVKGTTSEYNAYWENASVQAAGGNLACIPQMQNRVMADYADRGALRPLDDLVESGVIDVSEIPEGVLDSGRGKDGNLYMIPYGAAFGALLVNETQVEQWGESVPEDGYDWEELSDWLSTLVDASGTPAIDLFGGNDDQLEAWVRSQGDNLYGEDGGLGFGKDSLVDFWNYSEALREDGVTISAERGSELLGVPLEQQPFSQGQQPTFFWPANGLSSAQATIEGVTPGTALTAVVMPSGEAGPGNALWLSGLAISKDCDNVATAASFIDFFVNDEEAALVYASDNGANTNTANLEALLDSPDIPDTRKTELRLYAYLADADIAPVVYGKGYQSVFLDALARYYQQVSFGELSVEDAADAFIAEAEGTLG